MVMTCFYRFDDMPPILTYRLLRCAEQAEVLLLATEIVTTVIRLRSWESSQESSGCYRACCWRVRR